MNITFIGACRQITGSCYLLESEDSRVVIDCGLYQERDYLGRNWKPFPFDPGDVDALILTHAHLDHSGLTPKFVRDGFGGKIYVTRPTADLIPIVLLDAAHIQEEDAAYKKKRHKKENRTGPYPEIPLYTKEDAEKSLLQIESVPYKEKVDIGRDLSFRFFDAGHILGSSMVEMTFRSNGKETTIVFSGDIGQMDKPLVKDPSFFDRADWIVMESLYGDRVHEDPMDIETMLQSIINQTVASNGNILIPTFAIERAQEVMFYLNMLVREDKIPYMMMFLDSPMAVNVTEVFKKHRQSLDREAKVLFETGESPFSFPGLKLIRSVAESKAINNIRGSCLIMAGSGMCTGGRIKHHLVHNINDPDATILFVGYQAHGTLGRLILEGKESVRIHGRPYPVRARIEAIHGFSAHADRNGLFQWVSHLKRGPKTVFLTHGDPEAASALASRLQKEKGWKTEIPEYLATYRLT
ncbi:MAG: MBL fold metallo-hydrolase [Candidatus Aminicenantes bacterium]|nr:MBL fold metallo-hydrolase [Candidatus Aminicenantes bacterium]